MATKTSKLHTTFTGDDKHFQRAAGRVMKSGTQMGAMASKLKGAFAAMGGAMVVGGIIEKFDRIGKVAKRVGISAEEVQRLAHAAELSGTNFETLQAILTRLQKRIGEALQNPTTAAAKAFKELGLNAFELSQMGLKEQFFAVADAFKATGGGVEGVASLMKILDTEVRNLIPLFQAGSTGIQTMMNSATVATNATVKSLEEANDRLTEIKNTSAAFGANLLVGGHTVWERFSAKVSGEILKVQEGFKQLLNFLPGVDMPHLSAKDIDIGVAFRGKRQRIGDWSGHDKEKAEREKLVSSIKKSNQQLGFDLHLNKSIQLQKMEDEFGQKRILKAFASPNNENPFAETIEDFKEKQKKKREIMRVEGRKEEEQETLSGRFSQFVQTAGLGATFVGKTPEQLQLEKQTGTMESMLTSVKEFNSKLGELIDNTQDR